MLPFIVIGKVKCMIKSCYKKDTCPICGREVQRMSFNRHLKACQNPNSRLNKNKSVASHQANREDRVCNFCGKELKNYRACVQHEIRCNKNPNRKDFDKLVEYIKTNRKGKTSDNCEDIRKQIETIKLKYSNGYINPCRNRKVTFQYVYEDHNNSEIQKWLLYVKSLDVEYPKMSKLKHPEGYEIVSGQQYKDKNTVKVLFVHDYIANILLDGKLKLSNCVHHINKIRDDNRFENLMVFKDSDSHKRFHNSKNAYIEYDELTHLFSCCIKQTI